MSTLDLQDEEKIADIVRAVLTERGVVKVTVGDLEGVGAILLAATGGGDTTEELVEAIGDRIATEIPDLAECSLEAGSVPGSMVVSGLPANMDYIGQRLYVVHSAESRRISDQTYADGKYALKFTGSATKGNATYRERPFSAGSIVVPTLCHVVP